MEIINFSYNWNNKLNNHVFTTIRPHSNSGKYDVGKTYRICLNNYELKTAEIVGITEYESQELLTDGECLIDTGYSKAETLNILRTMYKIEQGGSKPFDLIFLKTKKEIKGIQAALTPVK